MIQIDKVQRIEGVTVFDDHDPRAFNVKYLFPERATIRTQPSGKLSFSFYKYVEPVPRPDGTNGGGFCLFDTAFVVDPATMAKVTPILETQIRKEANRLGIDEVPPLKIGTVPYTDGNVSLIIAGDDGTFVEKVKNSGKPSLYGDNSATFGIELTQKGATFFEKAMQGQGSSVGVEYHLFFIAKLPKVSVRAGFRASEFYSFYQSIDTDWNLWSEDSYRETVREQIHSSESTYFEPDWGMLTDENVKTEIRDWAMRTLEDGIERRMIDAIAPVPDDERKKPDGIEDVTRDITKTKISSFSLSYNESSAIEWDIRPNGPLPNITSLTDPDGNPYKWEDYSEVISLDDPLFHTIRVNTSVNASFDELPIHSVEVKLIYHDRPMASMVQGEPDGEVVLRDADQIAKFAAFVQNDDWEYEYSYQINYTGESRIFQSEPVKTNEGNLTIGVDDVGILAIDISAGDLNWNDVEQALVTFTYEDRDVPPIEHQFQLTKTQPGHRIEEVIFQPMRKSYEYQVKYFMKDGRELAGSKQSGRASRLFINDIFSARRDVGVRGVGDFATRINKVFLDLAYDDDANDHHLTKSIAIDANTPFFDWSFPVISETGGKVSYSGNVAYKDGTNEEIPKQEATSGTILVPKPIEDFLEVMVVTDLVDWGLVRLARVSLSYEDPDNEVVERKDLVFSPVKPDSVTWKVELKDRAQTDYTYTVTFFMADGTRSSVGPTTTSELTLILDPMQ
jgi:hypothetical protein